jgi:hypothetical protein
MLNAYRLSATLRAAIQAKLHVAGKTVMYVGDAAVFDGTGRWTPTSSGGGPAVLTGVEGITLGGAEVTELDDAADATDAANAVIRGDGGGDGGTSGGVRASTAGTPSNRRTTFTVAPVSARWPAAAAVLWAPLVNTTTGSTYPATPWWWYNTSAEEGGDNVRCTLWFALERCLHGGAMNCPSNL